MWQAEALMNAFLVEKGESQTGLMNAWGNEPRTAMQGLNEASLVRECEVAERCLLQCDITIRELIARLAALEEVRDSILADIDTVTTAHASASRVFEQGLQDLAMWLAYPTDPFPPPTGTLQLLDTLALLPSVEERGDVYYPSRNHHFLLDPREIDHYTRKMGELIDARLSLAAPIPSPPLTDSLPTTEALAIAPEAAIPPPPSEEAGPSSGDIGAEGFSKAHLEQFQEVLESTKRKNREVFLQELDALGATSNDSTLTAPLTAEDPVTAPAVGSDNDHMSGVGSDNDSQEPLKRRRHQVGSDNDSPESLKRSPSQH